MNNNDILSTSLDTNFETHPIVHQTWQQIFWRFPRFGCMAWGGPMAQIAMMRQELVEEEKWVSSAHFNRALAVYQVLPGPEAHELCVWFGMKVGGRIGGFFAGLGFMLPGFLLMLLMIWAYTQFGVQSPLVQLVFVGIQAAVVAMIGVAVWRIGKHAVVNGTLLVITISSGVILWAGLSFWVILLFAGLIYTYWLPRTRWAAVFLAIVAMVLVGWVFIQNGFSVQLQQVATTNTLSTPNHSNLFDVFFTGLKGGLLTFGGAYTAIPFIQQDAVIKYGWMSQQQFLDGIAISGILPAPLVIFSTFVGFFGGGWLGALLITLGMFLPAFSFTLIGHDLMEKLIHHPTLHRFLDGVTAGVIGLIGVTAVELFMATIRSGLSFCIFACSMWCLLQLKSKFTALVVVIGSGLMALAFNLLFA